MSLVRNASLPVSLWHNGAGRKADIASGEGWLVSFAWLDADAPFSDLPGIDRTITLVRGPGFTLDIAGQPSIAAHTPFVPKAFEGGAATHCRIAGPSRVLNVMTASERLHHDVSITGQPTPGILTAKDAEARFIILLQGGATMLDQGTRVALEPLDAVQLEGAATVAVAPDAVLALIHIDRL